MDHDLVYHRDVIIDGYVGGTLWVDTFTLFGLNLATHGGTVRML